MATLKADSHSQTRIGSASWISDEKDQVSKLLDERLEDFYFSFAEKPFEWLNARMDEIFTVDQLDVTDLFKTPGKLRGKTPGTARRRNRTENRAPLTDIFTSNNQIAQNSSHDAPFYNRIAQIKVAEDGDQVDAKSTPKSRFPNDKGKENEGVDGQYMLKNDTSTTTNQNNTTVSSAVSQGFHETPSDPVSATFSPKFAIKEQARSAEESFITAEEEQMDEPSKSGFPLENAIVAKVNEKNANPTIDEPELVIISDGVPVRKLSQEGASSEMIGIQDSAPKQPGKLLEEPHSESETLSDASSSPISIIRKSSLTFACLPAREPLAAKTGAEPWAPRMSNLDARRSLSAAKCVRAAPVTILDDESDTRVALVSHEEVSNNARKEGKTSTQRLQERLAMLGKSNNARLSKSVNVNTMPQGSIIKDLPPTPFGEPSVSTAPCAMDEPEGPWIEPISAAEDQVSLPKEPVPCVHNEDRSSIKSKAKSSAVGKNGSAEFRNGSIEVIPHLIPETPGIEPAARNNPLFQSSTSIVTVAASTTPAGSPTAKRTVEGPLSASKAKFYSVLQSAKGIFASSAGASAQAKIEVVPPPSAGPNLGASIMSPAKTITQSMDLIKPTDHNTMSETWSKSRVENTLQSTTCNVKSTDDLQEFRISTVHIELLKDAHQQAIEQPSQTHRQPSKEEKAASELGEKLPVAPPKDAQKVVQAQTQNEPRRLLKVGKDNLQKTRPAPVSIRVASQRIGQVAPSNTMLAATLQDSLAPPTAMRHPAMMKKSSKGSLHTSSSVQNLKGSTSSSSARPKALEVAARKKEMDEREAQRKAAQKRELERRRAAKQEEDRKQAHEQKAAEQQKVMEARNAAQRQAAEQRKAEAIRKNEEQRNQTAFLRTASFKDHNTLQPEWPQQHAKSSKDESGMTRPASRQQPAQDHNRPPVPHVNPAKPPKRVYQQDADENWTAAPSTLNPAKRRRTSNESVTAPPARPTMAPPIRLSAMRKDATNKQAQSFVNPPSYTGQSMHRSVVLAQHQPQHPKTPHANDMTKSANSRIAFAEAPNPPQNAVIQSGNHTSRLQGPKSLNTAPVKASPQYPNGETIELPEIATDSEESDDENGDFIPPDWADSPALRDLLRRQQLVDPMNVFGPIAPLMMEEVFKGNKDRHARFRARTSSANWNGPDRLTEEERRKDREAREVLEREGGWTFRGFNT